jgi:hypothetical protein
MCQYIQKCIDKRQNSYYILLHSNKRIDHQQHNQGLKDKNITYRFF